MSKSLTLSHNFQPEFSETLNDITEITVALEDGKIAVNKMYFLLAGRFWIDLFKSIDARIIDRIIIPDFSISYFEKFIELLTKGETKYTSSDVTYQFLSGLLANLIQNILNQVKIMICTIHHSMSQNLLHANSV